MDFVDEFFGNEDAQQRLHYDLHTAIRPSKNDKFAVYPYLPSGKYNKEQLAFLADCDVNTILLSQEPANTFSCFSAMGYQAHAFTVELGKVMPFGQNDMTKFTAVNHKLRELISQPETSQTRFEDANIEVFTVNQVINKSKEDFALNFGNDTVNFAQFNKGDLLASETGCDFVAQHDGEAIVFPNADVAIGQRAILTVIPYEL